MTTVTLTLAPCDSLEQPLTMAVIERAAIQTALEKNGGGRDAAARELDIDRKTLYRKLTWDPGLPDRRRKKAVT